MALSNNPTPSELVKEVKNLDVIKANIADVPVEYGTGKDTVKNKTPYDETDVDGQGNVIDRTNTVDGNFSAAFGSRNNIGSGSSETFVTGGKNSITHTEDALVSGYENTVSSSHQSIIGGYDNNVKASESVVVGEGNTLDGTITGASYKTDTRTMAVFGNSNSVGINNKHSLIAGEDNEMGINGKWNFEVGAHHDVGRNNECVNVLGWTNTTNGYLTDSTLAGYDNTAYGGASGNNTFSVYMLGHSNDNQDPSNPSKGLSEVYQIGHGLLAKHRGQVILGKYNRGNVSEVNDILTVGCGTSSSSRSNCFGTGNNGTDNYIRVGATPLTESKLTDLVDNAVTNFEVDGNTFSSNNSAEIKTINGDYDGLHNKLATGNDLANKMDKTLTGSSAPTTSTEGQLGQLYIDTTNNKTYQCYAITTENNTTTYTWREISGGGGTATDVQVDDVSQVVSGTANLKTINGDYDASTNKLATQNDIPTQYLPLLNNTEYKAFAFIENEDTDASHTTQVRLVLPTTIKTYDFCSKYTGLSVGDKILVFVTTYNKIATFYDKVSAVCSSTITAIGQYGDYSVISTRLGTSFSTQSLFAFKNKVPTTTSSVTQGSTSALTSGGAYTALSDKQDKTDSNLQTTSQTVVGAINEVNSIVKQANIAESYASYSAFITALNSASATDYKVGQSFYIETLEVPDLWVISVESSSSTYTYTTDSAFITATAVSGGQQVGYYKIGQLETQKVDISTKQDVIDVSHKLSADLVDDSSSSNKFMSSNTIKSVYGVELSASGELKAKIKTGTDYTNMWNDAFISKGTLEGVKSGLEDEIQSLLSTSGDTTQGSSTVFQCSKRIGNLIFKFGTGSVTTTANDVTSKTVNFDTPFPNACLCQIVVGQTTASTVRTVASYAAKNTTSITAGIYRTNSNLTYFNWLAIGY